MIQIKVGYCLAYDWEMLRISLPLVYDYADKICLSVDKNRVSWSGLKFSFDEQAFYAFVRETDTDNKISLYEDDFFVYKDSPMQNEVYQRNEIARTMGKDSGWHLQFDVDEYPVNMKGFASFLRSSYSRFNREINICLPFLCLFKQLENGFLVVKGEPEWIQIATTKPFYTRGRRNGYFNYKADYLVLHQSWARPDQDILNKVQNWGHKNDFDAMGFFRFWQNIDSQNYSSIRNFHPENPGIWKQLFNIQGKDVSEILNSKIPAELKSYSKIGLLVTNLKLTGKIKELYNKFLSK